MAESEIEHLTAGFREGRLGRRTFFHAALAAAVAIPLGGALASCTTTGSGAKASGGGKTSAKNPFGAAADSTVEVVIFKQQEFGEFVAKAVENLHQNMAVNVTGQTNVAQALQPSFVAGNPPDVVRNGGAGALAINSIAPQLATLDEVLTAKNYEGKTIADTLYAGVKEAGTINGRFVRLTINRTVMGLWYSASLFKENGWTVPKTWDGLLELGAKAKAKGKYLFGWGQEAATYYQTLVLGSAIKEGGDEVRLAIENLKPHSWSQKPIQETLKALKKIIDAGYIKPGGAGTQFTAAQAQWSNDQEFLLYPSGGWIGKEMENQTKAGFEMAGVPEPTISDSPKMPWETVHLQNATAWLVPKQGKNIPGAKEFLRALLSPESMAHYSKTWMLPTIVKGATPDDGFGLPALAAQMKMIAAGGDNSFTVGFEVMYGLNTDQLVAWNAFLQGAADVAELTSQLQSISDKVANDSSVKKVTYA